MCSSSLPGGKVARERGSYTPAPVCLWLWAMGMEIFQARATLWMEGLPQLFSEEGCRWKPLVKQADLKDGPKAPMSRSQWSTGRESQVQ